MPGAFGRLTAYEDFYASLGGAVAVTLNDLTSKDTTPGQQPTAPKEQLDDQ